MRKNQQGATLVEFSIVCLIFLVTIFSALSLGIDAVNRWQVGEEVETVLKKAENSMLVLKDVIINSKVSNLCNKDNSGVGPICVDTPSDSGLTCGFYMTETCEDIKTLSDQEIINKCTGEKTCIFWAKLYQVASSVKTVSKQQKTYLYGVGSDGYCRAPYAIVFPGFMTRIVSNQEDSSQSGSGSNKSTGLETGFAISDSCNGKNCCRDNCEDESCQATLKARLKRGDAIATKGLLTNLLSSFVGGDKDSSSEITHYGFVRLGFGSVTRNTPTNTPTATPIDTATFTPTDTPTDTPTNTPTVTFTPTSACDYYEIRFWDDGHGWILPYANSGGKLFQTGPTIEDSKCIDEIMSYKNSAGASVYYDDFVVRNIYRTYFTGQSCKARYALFNTDWLHMRYSYWWYGDLISDSKGIVTCVATSFYLDKQCKAITEEQTTGKLLCGDLDIHFYVSCPVSLLWNKDANVDENMSVVKFNLDLTKKDEWYAWKGSGDAPLLVYDPENTKQVKDASMLFGNFAFGGKGKNEKGEIEPWENGFEALRTLDKDNNGKVEGEELKGIYLWFDNNKNAISEDGEIKTLDEMGVKSLFVNNYEANEETKNIHMKVGYEKNENGNITTGEMIDWYTVGAPSEASLVRYFSIIKHQKENEGTEGKNNAVENEATPLQTPTKEEAEKVRKEALSKVERKFGGEWRWYLMNDKTKDVDLNTIVPQGKFALADGPEGLVHGVTFTQTFIKRSPQNNLNSYVNGFILVGKASKEGEQNVLNFEREYGDEKSVNKAVLSDDKNSMEGETTIINKKTNKVVISYKWKATRVR